MPGETIREALERIAKAAWTDYRNFLAESLAEEKEGRLRDAAEKLYAAYKSLLAYIVARHYLPRALPAASPGDVEWWLEKGLKVPSPEARVIAELAAEALGDPDISDAAKEALDLHDFFYYGYDPDFSRFTGEWEVKRYMESLRRRLKRLEERYV